MNDKIKKALIVIIILILLIIFFLAILGYIDLMVFWIAAILVSLFAFFVLPKINK